MPEPLAQNAALVREFTGQADAFARAAATSLAGSLDALLSALPLTADQRWLDVACGTGAVSLGLAARTGSVIGIDLTPAMLQRATADARRAGVTNVSFVSGDAMALPLDDASFDGAVIRFALHHIPGCLRVVREMARVVRPGGLVAAADHLTADNGPAAAWHHDIERLRDPSHWHSPDGPTFFGLGPRCGLLPVSRRVEPFELDYEEWLTRGSGGAANRAAIADLYQTMPPGGEEVFSISEGRLRLQLAVAVWRRPEEPDRRQN